ncbi:MAG: ribose 5-phosphate isomerase B [Planctomycetaceae bacterium]|jgi:ribose 5-phosphate isomerase B|nr:ribose 5-phosphate isomerase B [Planctomycetaceae bacterium]MBT4013761.1 ribose 5-phosphate isomerase B [Planctomycetaceae bacterium]MBT4726275.1 ribose 5-phosphate isomerase B [Planctomycetaceae bacterium]MBT4843838.1 ribose 5-phosphate isomerase B [Planctomycetaceae bacterium]MBT5126450.1 ribose 5-phosphate isomerase B [Planctomycetaceae bacterium]
MKLTIGSDHRGYRVKQKIVDYLNRNGHQCHDVGTNSDQSVDYPDIAQAVSRDVCTGDSARGILICGTGIGMAIAANKYPGVRAASCHDEITAEMSRRHNDANVLCLSADLFGERNVEPLLQLWLNTDFEGGRHERRVQKISEIENSLDSK